MTERALGSRSRAELPAQHPTGSLSPLSEDGEGTPEQAAEE